MEILVSILVSLFGVALATSDAMVRYDIIFYPDYRIPYNKTYETFIASILSECRRRCVDDPECTGWTELPLNKGKLMNCTLTRYPQPGTILQWAGDGPETYFKERKPKKYFYSTHAGYGSHENFATLCAQDSRLPGLVHTLQDYEYIKDNLMTQGTADAANPGLFLPLISFFDTNKTRKSNAWTGTGLHVLENHVLHRYFVESFHDTCNIITPTSGLTLQEYPCNTTELHVLCYQY
ncbi:uncharacterized protein LOC125177747 [Hyalella azteca]|uniref:Uncharacterized protein LOC125177747 n=1 Tax=Hyalella azteca TaxID=294128 RepID=A0A979FIE7_HYAAZ|nr:uncharacterized protein LOC125177747 [Hyalella azteca]